MVKHCWINFLCVAVIAAASVFTALFSYTKLFGVAKAESTLRYADKLFDESTVHTLDIGVDESGWSSLIENASDKEYLLCDITIDGETFSSAAIRAKGNTSLSSVKSLGGERYSFKVEFDHYQNSLSYYGLDKLSLNNLIFDKTYRKDYLVYDMMDFMGVDTPLASFVLVTVNGEPWGLYLAVEGVEEAFAQRNYGNGYSGELYKPDSMSAGADGEAAENENAAAQGGFNLPAGGQMPDRGSMPDRGELPEGFTPPEGVESSGGVQTPGGGFGGRSGSNDVALVYTDDAFSSYSHIFGGAVSGDVTDTDKRRLIASLKTLDAGENLESVVNVEEVLKYFVVHNFSLNFDSYTGSLMHNYYLYEENGQLSMIPWDYNLAFGAFNMGGAGASGESGATSLVNYPIDTPTSGATLEDRPLLGRLLENEEYLAKYHAYFDEFISSYFESGHFEALTERVTALIDSYVREDATAFYTYDEFTAAAETLEQFCLLRAQSIRGQLSGVIPATSEGQSADASGLVDAAGIDVSAMGSMSGVGGGGGMNAGGFTPPGAADGAQSAGGEASQGGAPSEAESPARPDFSAGGQQGAAQGGFSSTRGQGGASNASESLWLLAGSVALLLLGLLFAALYRRRRG